MLSKNLISTVTQIPAEQNYWVATLGGNGSDIGYGIAIDASGNIYVVGTTTSQGAGGNDTLITKYSNSGVIQWQRSLGGASGDLGYGIAVDASGNIYVTGYTASQGAGNNDTLIAKYNTSGVIQWQRSLGGVGTDVGRGIAVDASGDVYIIGNSDSQGDNTGDALVAKYSTSGVIQWQRSLGGNGSDIGYGIAIDASGNIYVVGTTTSQGAGGNDILIAKYDTSGTIQWQRSLGGAGTEVGYGIAVDAGGNVYITGATQPQGAGGNDILIAKYSTSGVIQWQRSLGGTGSDIGRNIAVDASGNIYVTGQTNSQGAGGVDALIAKYNTSGVIQWQRSLGFSTSDVSYGIAVDAGGNMYVAGSAQPALAGNDGLLIAKLPSDGSLTGSYGNLMYSATTLTDSQRTLTDATTTLPDFATTLTDATTTLTDSARTLTSTTTIIPVAYWIATLGGTGDETGRSVAVDANGDAYVAGFTASQGAGSYEALVIKYNSYGVIQWQRSLGGANFELFYGVALDASGNVYVTGFTQSQGAGGNDILIAKYDTSGTIQWQRSLGGAGSDVGNGVAVDASGNVYVAGYTDSQGTGSTDILITKYDTSGVIQWQRSLGGTGDDRGNGVAVDASGNVYVAGYTASQGAGLNDALITKYDTSGVIQWQRRLGGVNTEYGYAIAVDANGNVYITGSTQSQGAGFQDVLIAKYSTGGTIQWQRRLGGAYDDIGYSIAADAGGNVYVTGRTISLSAGSYETLITKYNTSGGILWQRSLGGTGDDIGYGVAVDASGNVYITGYTASQGAGGLDALIVKIPATGTLTGTYGNFTYTSRTLTAATATLTAATATLTDATTTLTSGTTTLTSGTTTLASTTATIQAGA